MANRVLWLNYRLTGGNHVAYTAMSQLSLMSACRHLQGRDWTAEIAMGDYTDRDYETGFSEMYRDMFRLIRQFYERGDNVLFLDPDVLFVKDTQIFGRFEDMMLFWVTDPPSRGDFDPYLNGGVVYLPASMDPALWRFVDESAGDMVEWNDSQDILNAMFWAQDPVPALHPELGWSPNVQNGCSREDAHLIHFNSTRGAERVLEEMAA